jgi:glycosyltransferase involved in cell wall biosynthesis
MTQTEHSGRHISVCIPVRNGERELASTLSNLLVHAEFPRDEYEVIIGDHGSTDGTRAVVERFSRSFPNLRRVDVPFTSANRALVRNRTIAAARGEILVFIDHDVLPGRSFLKAHAEAHARVGAALIVGETYGKGIYKRAIDELLPRLSLDDISASRSALASEAGFSDARNQLASLPAESSLIDLTRLPAPFRFGWTCNVSVRRSDVDECGAFDERYVGWGCEDDDFAQQLRVKNRGLFFSRDAWAFHVPHAVDELACLLSWRNNFEIFFQKFPTREAEYYAFYGNEIEAGIRRLEGIVKRLASLLPFEARRGMRVPPRMGATRLAHFTSNIEMAKQLSLTHALDPTLPLTATPRSANGVSYSPCLGIRTPFGAGEIDEVLLFVDELMYLDRALATLLLSEAARISQRALVCSRSEEGGPSAQRGRASFLALMDRVRFRDVVHVTSQ